MEMEKWSLKRTTQCAKCPWKCTTNPHTIPHGYDVEKHKALANTIANDQNRLNFDTPLQAMACHHSINGNEAYCIGWVHNQLTIGNNVRLRLKMMFCDNVKDIKIIGKQHMTIEDTLPKT